MFVRVCVRVCAYGDVCVCPRVRVHLCGLADCTLRLRVARLPIEPHLCGRVCLCVCVCMICVRVCGCYVRISYDIMTCAYAMRVYVDIMTDA